jgi:hypothetical protein
MEIIQLPFSTAPTKSPLHRLPNNSLLHLYVLLTSKLVPLITPWHGPRRKHNILLGTCIFAKVLLSNGCVYLLIKNLLFRCLFRVRYPVTGLHAAVLFILLPLSVACSQNSFVVEARKTFRGCCILIFVKD